jgi:hypothetical protein
MNLILLPTHYVGTPGFPNSSLAFIVGTQFRDGDALHPRVCRPAAMTFRCNGSQKALDEARNKLWQALNKAFPEYRFSHIYVSTISQRSEEACPDVVCFIVHINLPPALRVECDIEMEPSELDIIVTPANAETS